MKKCKGRKFHSQQFKIRCYALSVSLLLAGLSGVGNAQEICRLSEPPADWDVDEFFPREDLICWYVESMDSGIEKRIGLYRSRVFDSPVRRVRYRHERGPDPLIAREECEGSSVSGDVLIGPDLPGLADRALQALGEAGFEASWQEDLRRIQLYNVETPDPPLDLLLDAVPRAVRILEKIDDVEYAEPNYVYFIASSPVLPNDRKFRRCKQWGLYSIEAPWAWNDQTGHPDLIVAVVDSGIDLNHEDLHENLWSTKGNGNQRYGRCFLGPTYCDPWDPTDDNKHGSLCAGIIGASTNNRFGVAGVNWRVRLMALKFLGSNGMGAADAGAAAIEFATCDPSDPAVAGCERAQIISASWGGPCASKRLRQAIQKAFNARILFVSAAGNGLKNIDDRGSRFYPASYKLESGLKNMIVVGGTNRNDMKAPGSNFGCRTVDIGAPGIGIWSTGHQNDYRKDGGTSMATAFVSGAAAILQAQYPNADYQAVIRRLLLGARRVTGLKQYWPQGRRLDLYAALTLSDEELDRRQAITDWLQSPEGRRFMLSPDQQEPPLCE